MSCPFCFSTSECRHFIGWTRNGADMLPSRPRDRRFLLDHANASLILPTDRVGSPEPNGDQPVYRYSLKPAGTPAW